MLRRPTIHVIDDDPLFRDQMRSFFEEESWGDIMVYPDSLSVDAGPGDIVCLDLRLSDGSRPSATVKRLGEARADVIIVTTGASSAELQDCLRAGALGVVLKSEVSEGLAPAIDAVIRGGMVLNRETCSSMLGLAAYLPAKPRRVVELVAAGLPIVEAFRLSGLDPRQAMHVQQDIRRQVEERVVGWPPGTMTIGVVDDHDSAVTGVRDVLQACLDDRVVVVGAPTMTELLATGLPFAAVILDVLLADGSSAAANVRAVRAAHAEALLFTSLEPGDPAGDDFVNAALEAGAKALIFKGDANKELLEALKEVLGGGHYFNVAWFRAIGRVRSDMSLLTEREKEVYLKRRAGLSQPEIASLLHVTRETVKSHFKSINTKLRDPRAQ